MSSGTVILGIMQQMQQRSTGEWTWIMQSANLLPEWESVPLDTPKIRELARAVRVMLILETGELCVQSTLAFDAKPDRFALQYLTQHNEWTNFGIYAPKLIDIIDWIVRRKNSGSDECNVHLRIKCLCERGDYIALTIPYLMLPE